MEAPTNTSERNVLSALLDRADRALASQWRWVVLLFVVAFVLKLIYILQSAGTLQVRIPVMDSAYYDTTAQRIAAGELVQREAFFMGPLYPYFLSIIYAILGRDFTVVRIIQVLGGAATVALTFVIGRHLFRPVAAFAGAVLLLLYGAMTFYEGLLLMTWMGTLLNLVAVALLLRAARGTPDAGGARGWVWYAAGGLALGVSALARANVLVFVPVVLAWILWVVKSRRRVAQAVAFTAAVVAALLPATIHNYIASRDFVPVTSNAGLNFYIGNGEHATGLFIPLAEIDFVHDPTSRSYIERLLGRDMSPSEVSDYWIDRSLEFIRKHPGRELSLLARKFAMFFNGYEIPQMAAFSLERDQYRVLKLLFVNFWWICALGLAGLLFSLGQWRRHLLLSGFLVVFALAVTLFFITARYRMPVVPILCLFAGQALLGVGPRVIGSVRSAALFIGTVALLLIVTNPSIFAMDPNQVAFRQLVHDARRLNQVNDSKGAIEKIDQAIALFPDHYEGYWQRAIIYRENNNLLKAVEDYQRTLERKPDLPTVHYDFAQSLRQLGANGDAVTEYRSALELDPLMIEAQNNLGVAYREMHRYDDAIASFERVIELDPRYTKAYNNLGASLAESGRVAEAIVVFSRAIEMFPDYAGTYMNLAMAYVQQRRVEPAIEAVEGYLRLRPGDEQAAELLRKLRIARAAADSTSGQ